MRVISIKVLRQFWQKYPDAEQHLKIWNKKIKTANYQNANEVKQETPTSDQVVNNRIVFDILRNKYRLIVLFRYDLQKVYVRFIGTHKEYDQIKDIKNI